MADIKKNIDINVTTNGPEIQKQFEALREDISQVEKEVDELSRTFGENSKEADAARKSLADLNIAYGRLTKTATDTGASFEQVYGELQPLTTRLGEAEDRMYELALAGKQNTQEFRDLQQAAGNYRKTQVEVDLAVDAASKTFGQKLGGSLQAAAGGFAIAQGAAALFGSENEAIEKSIQKVAGALALVQGINAFKDGLPDLKAFGKTILQLPAKLKKSTAAMKLMGLANKATAKTFGLFGKSVNTASKSFKVLRGAIISTGIGLLVVGIGELIANWDEWSAKIGINNQALKQQREINTAVINDIATEASALDRLQREIDATNGDRELTVELIKDFQKEHPELLKGLDAEAAAEGEISKQIEIKIKLLQAEAVQRALIEKSTDLYKKKLETQQNAEISYLDTLKGGFSSLEAFTGLVSGRPTAALFVESAKQTSKRISKETAEIDKQTKAIGDKIKENLVLIEKIKSEAKFDTSDAGTGGGTKTPEQIKAEEVKSNLALLKAQFDFEMLIAKQSELAGIKNAKTAEDRNRVQSQFLITRKKLQEDYYNEFYKLKDGEVTDEVNKKAILTKIEADYLKGLEVIQEDIRTLKQSRLDAEVESEELFAQNKLNRERRNTEAQLEELQLKYDEQLALAGSADEKISANAVKLAKEAAKEIAEIEKKLQIDAIDDAKKARLDALQKSLNSELELYIGNEEEKKKITEKFAQERKKIEEQYGKDVAAVNTQTNEKIKQSDDKVVENAEKNGMTRQEINAAVFNQAVALANTLADLAQALIDKETKKIKAAYEERSRLNEQRTTELLDNEELTQEQRTEITRRAAVEEEELRLEEEELVKEQTKRAADLEFAITSANIIANTAMAISKTIGQLGVGSITPPGIALIAVMGAIGVAQLAIAKTQRDAVQGLAMGGMVYGAGTSTSDSIPVMLSNGESVINASATEKFAPILNAINTSTGGAEIKPKFAVGGVVGNTQSNVSSSDLAAIAGQGAVRAYVVESDVSSVSVRNSRIRREARLG